MAQLNLPTATYLVPAAVIITGVLALTGVDARHGQRARVPWLGLAALLAIYAGLVMFVMPEFDRQKVIPDVARWVASRAEPGTRVASYQLSRWNSAFRFYLDRPVTMLDDEDAMAAFFSSPEPFYVVMLQPAYENFRARGVPLREAYSRDGMWITSGRVLWRRPPAPTRFIVVTR
jgi:hypothetical protein